MEDPIEPTSEPIPCYTGDYCEIGSAKPTMCEAGYFCENLNNPMTPAPWATNTMTNTSCSIGFYCEQATTAEEICSDIALCPAAGNKFEGGLSISCPAGYYLSGSFCKFCNKGYVCYAGSESATPTDGIEGIECPEGNYCDPEISVLPI